MKAVVYAAKSTKDPRGSIPAQLQDCHAACVAEGRQVVFEDKDEAKSAYTGNRGGGLARAKAAAIRAAAADGEAELWVQHSDRLARGDGRAADHLAEVYFAMRRAGVRLRSVQDDSNLEDAIRAVLIGERNNEDSRRKAASVKAGMRRAAAERRQHMGGPRPHGLDYQRDADDRPIPRQPFVLVPAEVPMVRRVFDEADRGRSQRAIQRGLNADGVLTQRGRKWQQSSISAILRNPLYKGFVHVNGEAFPGWHPAIVSVEQWDRVNEMLDAAARSKGKGRGRRPKGPHLFVKGHLRCGLCGEAMVPITQGTYEAYLCFGRRSHGVDFCPRTPVKRHLVDGAVFAYFAQVGLDIEATRRSIADARGRKLAEVTALRDQAELEARRAEERLARVRRDYTDGRIDAGDWREFRDELGAERDGARAEADRLASQLGEVERWGEIKDAEAETLRRLAEIRAVVAGEVRDAEGVDAVRAALTRTFERFVLRERARVHVDLAASPGLVIEPVVREHALAGYTETLRPILRRQALNDSGQPAVGPPMFGPIELRPHA